MITAKREQALKQAATTYRQTLLKSLEHRLEVARAKGDQNLVSQLEAEAKYLHLS